MANLESFTAIIIPQELQKGEYIPVARIQATILAENIDRAEYLTIRWLETQLPFYRLDSIH